MFSSVTNRSSSLGRFVGRGGAERANQGGPDHPSDGRDVACRFQLVCGNRIFPESTDRAA